MSYGAMMNNAEKHENYSLNPTAKSAQSAKTRPQRDVSKEDARFEIPEALIDWLVKINQRHMGITALNRGA